MPAKTSTAKPDRSLIEGGEDHVVRELAVSSGLPVDEAEALVEKHGGNVKKLEAEVRTLQEERVREELRQDNSPN